jgi:hypothetical protein
MIAIIWQALLLGTFLQVPHYGLWPCETAKRLKSRLAERLALETNDKCFGLGAFRTARALTHAPSVREEDVHPPVPRVLAAVESAFTSHKCSRLIRQSLWRLMNGVALRISDRLMQKFGTRIFKQGGRSYTDRAVR